MLAAVCFTAAVIAAPLRQEKPATLATVLLDGEGNYKLARGAMTPEVPGAAAWGSFADNLNVTGWGVLNIRTSAKIGDVEQHYAAGYLEGALTAEHIYTTYLNTMKFTFRKGGTVPPSKNYLLRSQ